MNQIALTCRHVAPPNIDEDLGDGWRLDSILSWSALPGPRRYRAFAIESEGSVAEGFGDSPSAAYAALRTAIVEGDCPLCGQHLRDLARHIGRVHPGEQAELTEAEATA